MDHGFNIHNFAYEEEEEYDDDYYEDCLKLELFKPERLKKRLQKLLEENPDFSRSYLEKHIVPWSPTTPVFETIIGGKYVSYPNRNENQWTIKIYTSKAELSHTYNIFKVDIRMHKKKLTIYEKYVLVKDDIVPISMIPHFMVDYIMDESTILYSLQHISKPSIYTVPFFEDTFKSVTRTYKLAPHILDTRESCYIAIKWLLDILPSELVNIIYRLIGGIRRYVPDQKYLEISDFTLSYVASDNIGICTKSMLKELYQAKKLIVYYNDVYDDDYNMISFQYPVKNGKLDPLIKHKITRFFK